MGLRYATLMKIAIDTSPLTNRNNIRGVGFYLRNLLHALNTYFPEHTYLEFTNTKSILPEADIVHYPYFDPFSLSLPILNKKKTIVTVHDLTPIVFSSLFPTGIKGNLKWHMQRLALQRVSGVITDSDSSKKDILRLASLPIEKVHTVYLAAGEEFRVISNKTLLGKLKGKYSLPDIFALYVGDVTANKNLPRILEACLSIHIPIVMAGKALTDTTLSTNPWLADLRNVRNLAKEHPNDIRLLGFVPDKDIVALYNLASVFVMPSLYEGFGLPVVEAFSTGCPVVTSDKGSLMEIAGEAACIVDPYSSKSIASGIKKVLSEKNYSQELKEKGLKRAKEFSWKKTAEETIRVYKNVLQNT